MVRVSQISIVRAYEEIVGLPDWRVGSIRTELGRGTDHEETKRDRPTAKQQQTASTGPANFKDVQIDVFPRLFRSKNRPRPGDLREQRVLLPVLQGDQRRGVELRGDVPSRRHQRRGVRVHRRHPHYENAFNTH